MRSRRGRPEAWYFLAIETTSRKFDCTKVCWARSPARSLRFSSRRRAGVRSRGFALNARFRLATGLDRLGQADLVVLGQQRVLPDVSQVEPYEVFLVALDALLRQRHSLEEFGTASPPGSLAVRLCACRRAISQPRTASLARRPAT